MDNSSTPPAETSEATSLEATVVHPIFSNEENGWSVVRCRARGGRTFTATGPLLGVRDGDRVRLSGKWTKHPKFGQQFEATTWMQIHPATIEGIRRFLASRRIRGIGPRMADRLIEAFGKATLDVIENQPERLTEVPGIAHKTAQKIADSWSAYRGIQQVMIFLTGHGVAPGVAVKVFRKYGAAAIDTVRENPYRLADEIYGVGFVTADRIARSLGLSPDAPERLQAGLLFTLGQASLEGHVFLPEDELLATAGRLLECSEEALLVMALGALSAEGRVLVEERQGAPRAVFNRRLGLAERSVARHLHRILDTTESFDDERVGRAIDGFEQRNEITLAPQQRAALAAALTEPLVVITGGPGTGKTTLVRGVTKILARKQLDIELAAPTGRAAKRLSEATGRKARTIHRLLEFTPTLGTFQRNRDKPLEADLVVVDEVSMLDVELASRLLQAIPDDCRLILVGDADQLPSVGPGNVLADIIASGVVPVIRLDQIFRQADQSLIIVNAHRINQGKMPQLDSGPELGDFFFINRDDPEAAAQLAIDMVTRRIPRRFGFDPVNDVQVLAPMHRGELGVSTLNEQLQQLLVPAGPELRVGSHRFREGDKVMQVRNNYELEIFNGDIGRVTHVDTEDHVVSAVFDGKPVEIEPENLEDLMPAYACTIHKSQGSEYPAVVVLLHTQHHIMLQRNLLYTAVTRGKQLVVIVGSRQALHRAVDNATVRHRNTMLVDRLRRLIQPRLQPPPAPLQAGG